MEESKCPICFAPTKPEYDLMDYGTVLERYEECKNCGWSEHYAYGGTEVNIEEKRFAWSYSTSKEEKDHEIWLMKEAIEEARRIRRDMTKKALFELQSDAVKLARAILNHVECSEPLELNPSILNYWGGELQDIAARITRTKTTTPENLERLRKIAMGDYKGEPEAR